MLVNWKQTGIRMIILTMILLVCVPCPVKREIKLALNIPVSNQEPGSKSNKTTICQSFAEKTNHPESRTSKQLLKPVSPLFSEQFIPVQRASDSSTQYPDYPVRGTKIPLHILNEQYLI